MNSFINIPGSGAGNFKESAATLSDLPLTGNAIGDIRTVLDTGKPYYWNGSTWNDPGIAIESDPLAIHVDGSTLPTNNISFNNFKITNLADGTNPADAVNRAQLDTKQATGNYITALTGDVTASGPGSVAATVVTVGGSSASSINDATILANAATSANTASAIVRRDASGNFTAGLITAATRYLSASASAGTPSYGFSASSGVGMYYTGSSLAFTTGSNSRLVIGNSGHVAISTTAPTSSLFTIDSVNIGLSGTSTSTLNVVNRAGSGSTVLYETIGVSFVTQAASFTLADGRYLSFRAASLGASSTVTRLANINGPTPSAGINNAYLADNSSFVGNYFINSTSTNDTLLSGNILINTGGKGLSVKEGSNAKMGTATLVAGTVTVSNTSVTANSRIFLTSQVDGGTPGFLRVSSRNAGSDFTITSSSNTDTSTIAYIIFEPA